MNDCYEPVVEQLSPVHPSAQRQRAASTPALELVVRQVPPFRHGELAHGPSAAYQQHTVTHIASAQ